MCEFCEEKPAVVLCSKCFKCYCDDCNEYIHRKASKKGHKIEFLTKGVRVDARCPIHKEDPLKMFCVDEVKLCCSTCTCRIDNLHEGHNVVSISDIPKDNEVFSCADVRKRFADVLKCDDELEKKIEATISSIRGEWNGTKDKIKQTFVEAHKRLEEEEGKIMEELERVCSESEDALQKKLDALKEVCENSKVLSKVDAKAQAGKSSRLMELNIVCSMEKQRKAMEELHKAMMTDLRIMWDKDGRRLSFTRTLINGAPVPSNISFTSILSKGVGISWSCDLSRMSEEDKPKVRYAVQMKEASDEEDMWQEVYSGKDKKCSVKGLEMKTEYDVRVKCFIGALQGRWSDTVTVKTKKLVIDSDILSLEENGDTLKGKLSEWCKASTFELLYRGSRDGFGSDDFHKKCDNKGKTLTLVKNTSGHIFGGFATIPWTSPSSSCNHKQAPGSFLFTLTNMYGVKPTKFSLKDENDENAVCHNNNYCPGFGNSHDFVINSNSNTSSSPSWSHFPRSYNDSTKRGRSIFSSNESDSHFKVQEIEVFKVNI